MMQNGDLDPLEMVVHRAPGPSSTVPALTELCERLKVVGELLCRMSG